MWMYFLQENGGVLTLNTQYSEISLIEHTPSLYYSLFILGFCIILYISYMYLNLNRGGGAVVESIRIASESLVFESQPRQT